MNACFHQRVSVRRRGAVLVCTLACCLTALSLSVISVRLALRSARESKQVLKLRQAEWLLNAGVQRAKRNAQDIHYSGETWEIPATVTGSEGATVWIAVEPNTDGSPVDTSTFTITIESGTTPHAIRRSYLLTIATRPHKDD